MVAVVVVIVVIDHHELGQILWLFRLLLVGHFLRMMDRMRRSTVLLQAVRLVLAICSKSEDSAR
jgi:predicted membrane-bound mannosyltransferase